MYALSVFFVDFVVHLVNAMHFLFVLSIKEKGMLLHKQPCRKNTFLDIVFFLPVLVNKELHLCTGHHADLTAISSSLLELITKNSFCKLHTGSRPN